MSKKIEGFESVTLKIVGLSPLLMHNTTLVNPLHPQSKEFKALSSNRKKTDQDLIDMQKMEFLAGIYHNPEIGPYLPSHMLKAVLVAGAMKQKNGPQMKAGAMVLSDSPLEYEGPRDLKGLWDDDRFRLVTQVNVQKNKVMRTRPRFESWACATDVCYAPDVINRNDIIQAAQIAGQMLGIGDWRVAKGGIYGRFAVESAK